MPHVWYHCGGVGQPDGTRPVDLPHYPGGIATFAWEPPHGMPPHEAEQVDKKLAQHHSKMLEIMSQATGLAVVDDGLRHVIDEPYPDGEPPP